MIVIIFTHIAMNEAIGEARGMLNKHDRHHDREDRDDKNDK